MKRFDELLKRVQTVATHGPADIEIAGLTCDSRTAERGFCFFAIAGTGVDGHDFIDSAIDKGATAVVCGRLPGELREGVCYAVAEDCNEALGVISSAFYDDPSRELKLVGVTGTNGKTTTATLLCDLFRMAGYEAGLISTVVYRVGRREIEATHTTPDAIRLNAMLREMVDCGCEYCFMECSSHAIVQRRIGGLHFAGGLFTNLTHDHLDYHKTFAEYLRAKKMFFDGLPATAFAVTNIDDRNGRVMVQNTRAKVCTLSLRAMADFRCKVVEMLPDAMLLRIDGAEVWVKFSGRFNASNLLTVYAAARMLGLEQQEVLTSLSMLRPVSGRFEMIRADDGTTAIVDYAHTPDALENVIATIGEFRNRSRLIVVCGCGGERDKTKRPEMAAIAVQSADLAIFTSDNPRREDPEQILNDMIAGLPSGSHFLRIADRAEAIKTAVLLAHAGDIILLAGKGHETYQIIGTEKHHFDDREEVRKRFAEYGRLSEKSDCSK